MAKNKLDHKISIRIGEMHLRKLKELRKNKIFKNDCEVVRRAINFYHAYMTCSTH